TRFSRDWSSDVCSSDLHLDVGIAVLQVEAADQVAVGLDAVGIVDVARRQEAQQVGFAGLDLVLEAVGRKRVVADELDRGDAGLRSEERRGGKERGTRRP